VSISPSGPTGPKDSRSSPVPTKTRSTSFPGAPPSAPSNSSAPPSMPPPSPPRPTATSVSTVTGGAAATRQRPPRRPPTEPKTRACTSPATQTACALKRARIRAQAWAARALLMRSSAAARLQAAAHGNKPPSTLQLTGSPDLDHLTSPTPLPPAHPLKNVKHTRHAGR